MAFRYAPKETYTQADLDDLLKNHSKYIKEVELKGYVSPKDHQTVLDELAPFKQEAKDSHIKELVKDLTDADRLAGALKMTSITDTMSDEDIKAAVAKTISENAFLQKPELDDSDLTVKTTEDPNPEPEDAGSLLVK